MGEAPCKQTLRRGKVNELQLRATSQLNRARDQGSERSPREDPGLSLRGMSWGPHQHHAGCPAERGEGARLRGHGDLTAVAQEAVRRVGFGPHF